MTIGYLPTQFSNNYTSKPDRAIWYTVVAEKAKIFQVLILVSLHCIITPGAGELARNSTRLPC